MTEEASKPRLNHNTLEDEETTTDGEESKSMEVVADAGGSEGEDEDEDESSEEEAIPEPLAPNRLRRANAGNKMAELMNSAIADDFYESAYNGGFKEDDTDNNFAPLDDSDEDEVDSDFDQPEEDEPASGGENEEAELKKTEKKELLAKNRNWAKARFNKFTVNENACDAKTQQQRLAEAKETEKLNIASLKRFEEFELERKKRHAKPVQRQRPIGPIITTISKAEPTPTTIVILPQVKVFEKPERREYRVCAATGRPARYVDPLTDLPYADLNAFRQIRASYKAYVQSVSPLPAVSPLPVGGITEPMDTSVANIEALR